MHIDVKRVFLIPKPSYRRAQGKGRADRRLWFPLSCEKPDLPLLLKSRKSFKFRPPLSPRFISRLLELSKRVSKKMSPYNPPVPPSSKEIFPLTPWIRYRLCTVLQNFKFRRNIKNRLFLVCNLTMVFLTYEALMPVILNKGRIDLWIERDTYPLFNSLRNFERR